MYQRSIDLLPYQFIRRLAYITKASTINNPMLPTSKAVSSSLIRMKMKMYKRPSVIKKTAAVFQLEKWLFA